MLESVCYTACDDVRIAFDMIALGKYIWLLFIEVPDFGTRFCKMNFLIKTISNWFYITYTATNLDN
jgi:hypothetical protein